MSDEKVKIVFLLTLNGRALRQVYRLIKALYSVDHYYYIHIDAVSMLHYANFVVSHKLYHI
jgi:glycerol-3-phosphate responsive antiterminator